MLLAVLGMAATNVAFAEGNTTCPAVQQAEMDGEFGAGTSAITARIPTPMPSDHRRSREPGAVAFAVCRSAAAVAFAMRIPFPQE